ncbi:MAG TPA: hypothetical protein VGM11_12265 [Acidobacteriaceae bacterium]
MARISQQTKDVLSVLATIGVGIASGFYVDARGKHEPTRASLIWLVVCALVQLALALVPSQDMEDLAEFRKEEVGRLKVLNTMSEQAQKAAEAGDLSKVVAWDEARAKIEARRKAS